MINCGPFRGTRPHSEKSTWITTVIEKLLHSPLKSGQTWIDFEKTFYGVVVGFGQNWSDSKQSRRRYQNLLLDPVNWVAETFLGNIKTLSWQPPEIEINQAGPQYIHHKYLTRANNFGVLLKNYRWPRRLTRFRKISLVSTRKYLTVQEKTSQTKKNLAGNGKKTEKNFEQIRYILTPTTKSWLG